MFIVESSPDNCRGFASAFLIFAFVITKLVMFSVASPNLLGTSQVWFVFPLFGMISSTIVFCFMVQLPESPKWLIQQDKVEEAKVSIRFYHGKNCTIHEVVTSFIKEKNLTDKNRISLKQIWDNETLREGLKIVFALLLFLEFDTSYVTSVYTIDMHKSAGFTVQQALNINLIITIFSLPTKFFGTFLSDSIGRRPIFVIAALLQYFRTCIIFSLEITIYIFGSSWLTRITYNMVEFLAALVSATGVNSLRLLLTMELFPPSARTVIGQTQMIASILIGFPILSSFPIINTMFPPIFFVPFVITQLLLGIYLFRHMPETRGRAVYDIIESLDKNVASRATSILEENTPLIKNRARTFGAKRNSILNTPRSRAVTFNHKFDSES
ncbi:MFS domain-containing protein [Caenorhabditis elegans]|uniref:MFS domain-containing protein n=1 Tax=Caenorhabditis elegans TaxID=6239 RepID=Q9GYQ1_CAEEL|nr:MFS domain-containing protein [Caenorhabditis elegans]CCD69235.2 MFS domain-containing protein [Caenorhabditis elegans]|eukprot:NP_508570.4 Uncharacterized protein CELE_F11D5.5 [Caenorhabditis elegans]